MEILVEIIQTIIWLITVLLSVVILRKGIFQLILNLKKLKYKDLELEFKKEAITLRANIERDIPKVEPLEEKLQEESIVSEPRIMYSIGQLSPSAFILSEWGKIEKAIFSLLERHNINYNTLKSIRLIIEKLRQSGVIDSAIENALLNLSLCRNRIVNSAERSMVCGSVKTGPYRIPA